MVSIKIWRRHSGECTAPAVTGLDLGWCLCAHRSANGFSGLDTTHFYGGGGWYLQGCRGVKRGKHCVSCVLVLGVGLGPMAKSVLVLIVDLIWPACHPVVGVVCGLVEVEPAVPCVCVLGLILILIGEEFDCKSFAGSGVLNPISGAAGVPLGGS